MSSPLRSANLTKPPLSWRILDLLKVQSSPKPSRTPSVANLAAENAKTACKCSCCGTILVVGQKFENKFHCSECHTTNLVAEFDPDAPSPFTELSYLYVRGLADLCLAKRPKAQNAHQLHEMLQPLSDYLLDACGSMSCLNHSFRIKKHSRRAHYSSSNLDLPQVARTFNLLALLPSKRPLYCALTGLCNCLKRLPLSFADNPRSLYWVVLCLEIPFLHKALTNSDKRDQSRSVTMVEVPEIQALCYDILKRVLGILSQAELTPAGNYLASWFLKLSNDDFLFKINLINLYITFHLKKYFYFANNPELARRGSAGSVEQSRPTHNHRSGSVGGDSEYFQYSYLKDEVEIMNDSQGWPRLHIGGNPLPRKGSTKRKQDAKIRYHQYGHNYHLRTAAGALGIFVKANFIRQGEQEIPMHAFYNSLVDYVNIKLDFDSWLSNKKVQSTSNGQEPALQTVLDYIHDSASNYITFDEGPRSLSFSFCQYPFLISLGGKISILEYEARRQMERKAEEAFINSLDRRIALEVYFKVRVRREYIVQDSLRCIQLNQNNLKKGLKVQFINEPGVDAGGLKKEWFLLLTRALFSPQAGMLQSVEDSNYLWFNVIPIDNFEIYYLFGAVLGLAIYNSTILDLKFPPSMYKILLGLPLGLADYQEIYPVAARNLFKLREYNASELEAIDITFEVTFTDVFGKIHHRDLIDNGSNVSVTTSNREFYIDRYARFFLTDGLNKQLCAFKSGFSSVVDGNAFSLFLPDEIQLLLCGSEQTKFDVDVLKSVTQYCGWRSKEAAELSPVVIWFWDYVSGLTFKQQKKVLLFITGSDRVPATGIQNLSLKISCLDNGNDSERLPVAHTCFNELSIYEYSSREKFYDKLTKAVNMLAGFGIK